MGASQPRNEANKGVSSVEKWRDPRVYQKIKLSKNIKTMNQEKQAFSEIEKAAILAALELFKEKNGETWCSYKHRKASAPISISDLIKKVKNQK